MSAEVRVDGRARRFEHRRPELLAAAVEYVLDHGITELSLRPMAKALGVTHGTLLRHFGTKEELVVEVVTTIRGALLDDLVRSAAERAPDSPADAMRAAWRQLCRPAERRQFVLLFELVALEVREPGRLGSLATLLVTDFLGPIQAALETHGMSRRDARRTATGFLAQVRGLQMDLAVSGDTRRVDAAMEHYIESVTRPHHEPDA
ncbi:TetR/AcrR family transcriptional regulator [Modestobacter sp. SSW1-42]|uniref:TetR/AcrR family transcriptional regulator n=1 Tax=Modestobacter sp. SSW1-42 TaxID=596372 RepID=UPI003987058A